MSQLEPYLFFNGNCAEAMRFYEKALGGKLEMMMKASEAPPEAAKPARKRKDVGDAVCTLASWSRAGA